MATLNIVMCHWKVGHSSVVGGMLWVAKLNLKLFAASGRFRGLGQCHRTAVTVTGGNRDVCQAGNTQIHMSGTGRPGLR